PALGGLGDPGHRVRQSAALVHGDGGPALRRTRERIGHRRRTALVPGGHEPGPRVHHGVRDVEVSRADHTEDVVDPAVDQGATDEVRDARHRQRSTRATARAGAPDPVTMGSGPTIRTAPVGGSDARFCSWVRPYFPLPIREEWHGKAGSKEWAAPASVPTVSTPTPITGDRSATHRAHSGLMPGVCGPVSSA